MIGGGALRRMAAERKLGLDLIEKDYVLGWILKGISECSVRDKLIFKGGTALSKVYFPLGWRISEDLDFTLLDNSKDGRYFFNSTKRAFLDCRRVERRNQVKFQRFPFEKRFPQDYR